MGMATLSAIAVVKRHSLKQNITTQNNVDGYHDATGNDDVIAHCIATKVLAVKTLALFECVIIAFVFKFRAGFYGRAYCAFSSSVFGSFT